MEGTLSHIGPVETVTPLLKRLDGASTCAQVSLCAGVVLWGAWRLQPFTPVAELLLLAEAAFAWQVDWRYVDSQRGPTGTPPDQPPALSASLELHGFLRKALLQRIWETGAPPVARTFHASHVVRHVLPKGIVKSFESWFTLTTDKAKLLSPGPVAHPGEGDEFASPEAEADYFLKLRGVPLPPQVIDPSQDVKSGRRAALLAEFRASLDPARNKYLRTTDEMRTFGFVGEPYVAARAGGAPR